LAAFTGADTAIFWNLEVSWPAANWLLEPVSTWVGRGGGNTEVSDHAENRAAFGP